MDFLTDSIFLDSLTWLSLIVTIIGLYYIGKKNKLGFVYHTVSVIIQGYLFYIYKDWPLVAQMLILTGFNIRNYFLWRNEDANDNN